MIIHKLRFLIASSLIFGTISLVLAAPPPMNVLFIGVDDLRPQLGCYGDNVARTPNIDALAKRGLLFTRAYCQQAVCNPSRASMMTGLRPDTIRVWDLETHFRKTTESVVTLPQYFKQNGYTARSVGKIYHDPKWAQDPPSWSAPAQLAVTMPEGKYAQAENRPPKGKSKGVATERSPVADTAYIDGQVGEASIRLLKELKDKPFFLAVGFRRPHLPFTAPEKYWDMYDPASLPLPQPTIRPPGIPEFAFHDSAELRGYADIPTTEPLSEAKVRQLIHGYYASISYVDAQIGKLLDAVSEEGLSSNTLIVLWSDHGYHLGEKGLWCKTTNFELDTRVPLIISWPGDGFTQKQTPALAELLDLYPTIADLAGLPPPPSVEGISLKPLFANPKAEIQSAAYSQFPRPMKKPEVMGYSVRTGKYRYTEWRRLKDKQVLGKELYDHDADPAETKNLADTPELASEVKKLSALLDKPIGER